MPNPPVITLLTDFGDTDYYVAAMKGVVLGICPGARLVDISHKIKAFDIEAAAFTLAQAYPCFPAGTTHLIVVDPGVGSARRPLLLEAGGHRFIAPDNGVLTFPLLRHADYIARVITNEQYFRQPVSHTFHGRDIFSPVAAHVAAGVPSVELGEQIPDPVLLDSAAPAQIGEGRWEGRVLAIDHFGNIVTNFDCATFAAVESHEFRLRLGTGTARRYCTSYSSADPGLPVVVRGSAGFYEVSLSQQDAARQLGAGRGDRVELDLSRDQS